MICPASPTSHLSVVVIRGRGGGGDQLSCAGPGCGDSLPKCPDVRRTPCEPPICTSWNICRAGTSHLKGVQQRADTTHRSACTGLTILGDRRAARRAGGTRTHTHTHTHTHTKRGSPVSVTPGHVLISAVHEGDVSLRCEQQTVYRSVLRRQRAFF